ncbi:KAP family P-loop NTPase fold protein [Halodesulfovibrio marinisediminis]|uniref:KAP family P-loop domain-containing protein n=1 Tax=Halodesulfovibrio marinisediminis DSM 17456 TaxID=1121457 RepID=A0A1N6DPA0_9BACT|nr:P-loop NTPase fold protein [Halodesulfovibrio marinisediminis]SIN72576.1 KAP family P-loop domain-containing protein [Halodesulfovibrio marinisediminis DSM 17456]
MRLFPPEPVIGPRDGFNGHDIFGYAKFGEQLKDFYAKFDDPLVGVLDAPWGSGKSTFIKMWCGHMRNAGYPVIEFDAFKNDYTNDAFMALVGEVFAKAEEYCNAVKESEESVLPEELKSRLVEKGNKFYQAARKRGVNFLKITGNGIAKKLAGKVIGDEEFAQLKEEFGEFSAELIKDGVENGGKEIGTAISDLIDSKFAIRSEEKRAFEDFSEQLSEIAKQLSMAALRLGSVSVDSLDPNDTKRPLIFVIDELDRCKPTFALELLEKIKHFFSVPNVHFLLVTNLDQLSKVVKCEYGSEIDGATYLQKFYDVVFSLPNGNQAYQKEFYETFCNYVIDTCDSTVPGNWFTPVVLSKQLSLRSIIKAHAYSAGFIGRGHGVALSSKLVYIGLGFMKVISPEVFAKALEGSLELVDIHSFFDSEERSIDRMKSIFTYLIGELPVEHELRQALDNDFFYYDCPSVEMFAQNMNQLRITA